MTDSKDLVDFRNPNNILWKAIHVEKKLSRHILKEISLTSLIEAARSSTITIKSAGFIITGITKIFVRKFKFLYEDCNEIFLIIASKPVIVKKSFKPLASKGITLSLDDDFINDEMVDLEGSIIIPEETVIIDDNGMNDFFDDFGNTSYVEQIREDSVAGISNATDVTQIEASRSVIKRRKIVNDLNLEFDTDTFRRNLRDTRDILLKANPVSIADELSSKLVLAPEIISKLRILPRPRESIEAMRDISVMDDAMFEPDFSVDRSFTENEIYGEDETGSEADFNITGLGSSFIFNEVIEGKSRLEKSKNFLDLLNYASKNLITVKQSEQFGPIQCQINQ